MNTNFTTLSPWDEISSNWPDPLQFRSMDKGLLLGFPYARGYMRNLITGNDPDPDLKPHVFYIGKFPAIRKQPLINWLNKRTR